MKTLATNADLATALKLLRELGQDAWAKGWCQRLITLIESGATAVPDKLAETIGKWCHHRNADSITVSGRRRDLAVAISLALFGEILPRVERDAPASQDVPDDHGLTYEELAYEARYK